MLLPEDVGLLTNAMKVLNAPPSLIEQVVLMLNSRSDGLHGQVVDQVPSSWFGGSTNAHRIGVNTQMAHQAVEEEFEKLAGSLRQYGDAITKWAEDVRDVDGTTNAEMTMRTNAIAQVNSTLDEARDDSSSSNMGDGQYTEPPTTGSTTEGGA